MSCHYTTTNLLTKYQNLSHIQAEIAELELLNMNITLPLRYDDGQLLDLEFETQEKIDEKNDKLAHAAHVIGVLIARKTTLASEPDSELAYPAYCRMAKDQVPLIIRTRSDSTGIVWIINRQHIYYVRWKAICTRCYNTSSESYLTRYGSRKITGDWMPRCWIGPNVHRENAVSFYQFVFALELAGRRPAPEYTIDRIKVNCGYTYGNIRWASPKVQSLNKGVPTLHIPFEFSNPNFFKVAKALLKSGQRSNASQREFRLNLAQLMKPPNPFEQKVSM